MKKILILAALFISIGIQAQIGFTSFDTPASSPTTAELLAAMTAGQKTGIVDAFSNKVSITQAKHTLGLSTDIVLYFYTYLKQIGNTADQLMADPENNFNQTQLTTAVYNLFSSEFTAGQITYVINKRIAYSKSDSTGDWAYYSSQFE